MGCWEVRLKVLDWLQRFVHHNRIVSRGAAAVTTVNAAIKLAALAAVVHCLLSATFAFINVHDGLEIFLFELVIDHLLGYLLLVVRQLLSVGLLQKLPGFVMNFNPLIKVADFHSKELSRQALANKRLGVIDHLNGVICDDLPSAKVVAGDLEMRMLLLEELLAGILNEWALGEGLELLVVKPHKHILCLLLLVLFCLDDVHCL